MAANTSKSKIEVVLAPHRSLADKVNPTWPRPSGVKVRFRNGSDKPDGHRAETREGAISVGLKPGIPYEVEIESGDEWGKWWVPAERTFTVPGAGKPGEPAVLTLVPRSDRWLVWLRLCREGPHHQEPVLGATVSVAGQDFRADPNGQVIAVAAGNEVELGFEGGQGASGERVIPRDLAVTHPVPQEAEVSPAEFLYINAVSITIEPVVRQPDGTSAPLPGADVTAEYHGPRGNDDELRQHEKLKAPGTTVQFEFPLPGVYQVSVTPPAAIGGWPVKPDTKRLSRSVTYASPWRERVECAAYPVKTVILNIATPAGRRLDQPLQLEITGPGGTDIRRAAGTGGLSGTIDVPDDGQDLTIGLAPGAPPTIGAIPVDLAEPGQVLPRGTGSAGAAATPIVLQYAHAVTGNVADEAGNAVPDAVIEVFDQSQRMVRSDVADADGHFTVGVAAAGDYFVSARTTGGGLPVTRFSVRVDSLARLDQPVTIRTGAPAAPSGPRSPREAVTDLSSYPVLTEEVSTGGGFPVPGGPGPGGGGYGPSVEQVMRDVLGWRPSKDVAGFQAALAGAFELREVPGHTEVTWQQRGYSAQADMGALTGAQASIYLRAVSALDQVKPLLAGLTSLDPSVSTGEEREAVRAVVTAELTELVSELSLEGGPRVQRVDELFTLLTGQSITHVNPDPNLVGGQLGVLRERFALTDANVDTIDDERVQTNFRVVVEQVLALQASWAFDRGLLVIAAGSSLGTLLIALSRSLEAVGDSLDELSFTLDSVFIDAAQRQVVQLSFANVTVHLPDLPPSTGTTTLTFPPDEPPMFLSDLLDWVSRATREEGPRLIQDTGRDGVAAFTPVLNQLRTLVRATRVIAGDRHARPDGLRTSRVHRALDVLIGQLDQAVGFAALIQPPADEQNSD